MTIALRPVEKKDLDALFELRVRPDQQNFVAPNVNSVAEFAYITGGYVFAIWHGTEIVGLLGVIDLRENDEVEDVDDPKAAFLMRLMLADGHQRKGIGKAAMQQALDWARARGNSGFQTSVVPGNDAAMQFYQGLGLQPTGHMIEGEIQLNLTF